MNSGSLVVWIDFFQPLFGYILNSIKAVEVLFHMWVVYLDERQKWRHC